MDDDGMVMDDDDDEMNMDEEEIIKDKVRNKDEGDIFLNWNKTAYVPEPHLITEEAFNSLQPSYEKYFLKFWQNSDVDVNNKELTNVTSMLPKPAKDMLSDTTVLLNRNKNITLDTAIKPHQLQLLNHTKYHILSEPKRFSCISEADVSFYIANYNKLQHLDDEKNKQRFKEIQLRITKEQQEYQSFLRFSAQQHLNDYLYISSSVKEKLQNENFKEVVAVLEQKNAYSQIQTIEIIQENKKTPFNFIGNVCSQKQVDILKPSSCLNNLSQRINPCAKLNLSEKDILNLSVTEESLFYIKEESFINIVESFVLNKCEWLIPITVTSNNGKMSKTVLVENPFPKRSITARDAYAKYYEKPLKDLYCDSQGRTEPRGPSVNAFLCGEFKLLIETEIDYIDPSTNRTYSLLPKAEMQCSVGFELFSVVELCKAWWKSRIANTDFIVCSRIDVRNDCLARTDIYSRDMLCSHGSPYNPNIYFSYLNQLLDNLCKCEPGEYLLERSADNKNLLLFKKNGNGLITLDMKYSDRVLKKYFFKELEFPWLPIDCNIGNQLIANKVIPCLFPRCIKKPSKKSKRSRKSKTRTRKNTPLTSSALANEVNIFNEDQNRLKRSRKSRTQKRTNIPSISSTSANEVDFFSEDVPRALTLKKRQNIAKPYISTHEDIIEF
ncbi:uncharacterized protein LOC101236021 isoform X2 [Hydra vulgaris]|uniref:Uncharacterized protein LOC101236021 isoform X2 n=1 Tax=Hydra vulgaris TaxID=6087 RepID=A0ABM4B7L6_HYDVU